MKENLLIGIDVGGTKVAGALVRENGQILSRAKYPTPPNAGAKDITAVIEKILKELTHRRNLKIKDLSAIGIAIPGIVDSSKGKILVTPNVGLSGWSIGKDLEKDLGIKVFVGNDVNLGLLAEKWLGAARDSQNVLGVFPGTGIGGAAIINGELITGFQGAAAEFGHIILLPDGPKCGCGNRGCLEALASRKAIERHIRELIKDGRKSLITKYTDGDLRQIKSKVLAKALAKKDKVVIESLEEAAKYLGLGCVSLRHIFDPEMIVFGGGLIEACGNFIIPIVQKILDRDPFFAPLGNCKIVRSSLADDAVTLGAAALALQQSGKKLLKKKAYPLVECSKFGEILVNDKVFTKDIYIRADGKVKKRIKKFVAKKFNMAGKILAQEVAKICKKKPDILIVGAGQRSQIEVSSEARKYLKDRGIELKVLPAPQAASVYNETDARKALLMHLAG